jgi:hypothetical protein
MEDPIPPFELIFLSVFLGLPVYAAFIALLIIIQKKRKSSWLRILLIAPMFFILSAGLALLIWAYWPFKFDIMQAQFINIPATIACSIVLGLWLLITRIKTYI